MNCAICGCDSWRTKYRFAGVTTTIRQCAGCGLMALDPLPSEEDLKSVYTESYFSNSDLVAPEVSKIYGYADYIAERINKQKGYLRIAETLRQILPPADKAPELLDFGCGLGFFLDAAFDFGFAVSGVEFNPFAINYIRSRYAHPVQSYEDFLAESRQYDVLTLFDVIEHLLDPFAFLAAVRARVSDGGLLVISTMDSLSFISRIMGTRLEDFRRIREHVYFFSRGNMKRLLRSNGFEIVEMRHLGHSFELAHLLDRAGSAVPWLRLPFKLLLKLFPFAARWNIYLDPRTKFIVYARKCPNA